MAATPGSAPISIGRAKSGGRYTGGLLDEVAIYPAVLTPAQVATHFVMSTAAPDQVTLQLSATDPDGDVLTYSAADLPPGLTLHAQTGLITGTVTPDTAGAFSWSATICW